jgi:hypothetical protein
VHLDRHQPAKGRQVERGHCTSRQVDDDEDRFAIVAAEEGEHLPVGAAENSIDPRPNTDAAAQRTATSSSQRERIAPCASTLIAW